MESTAIADSRTPVAEITETASQTHQPSKSLSFTNGTLKRHQQQHHENVHAVDVSYKECLKNHAATLGGHALDGCGEFMPSPSATPADPTSLKCAACGCHRNFHRREPEEGARIIEYHSHPAPPPPPRGHSPSSPSPPPISSSYYPSAPHMLLALRTGLSGLPDHQPAMTMTTTAGTMNTNANGKKRFRTKFSQEQKEKMHSFSERLGWKMHKGDEQLVEEFCNEVGIAKGVLKVWMHNHKLTLGKRDVNDNGSGNSLDIDNSNHKDNSTPVATNNCSSSSS